MGSYANAKYLCLPLVRLKAVGVKQHSCEVSRGFTDQTKACWSQLQVMLCLTRGPCHVLCVGYSEIFLLGKPGVLGAADFPGLGQELNLLPAVIALPLESHSWVIARAGMLLCLPGRACSTTGMGTLSTLSLACLSSSAGAAVPRRCTVRVCCSTSCWSFLFRAAQEHRNARAWILSLTACLDANSVGFHLIMKCKCWSLFYLKVL